jgi:hypothetical protein
VSSVPQRSNKFMMSLNKPLGTGPDHDEHRQADQGLNPPMLPLEDERVPGLEHSEPKMCEACNGNDAVEFADTECVVQVPELIHGLAAKWSSKLYAPDPFVCCKKGDCTRHRPQVLLVGKAASDALKDWAKESRSNGDNEEDEADAVQVLSVWQFVSTYRFGLPAPNDVVKQINTFLLAHVLLKPVRVTVLPLQDQGDNIYVFQRLPDYSLDFHLSYDYVNACGVEWDEAQGMSIQRCSFEPLDWNLLQLGEVKTSRVLWPMVPRKSLVAKCQEQAATLNNLTAMFSGRGRGRAKGPRQGPGRGGATRRGRKMKGQLCIEDGGEDASEDSSGTGSSSSPPAPPVPEPPDDTGVEDDWVKDLRGREEEEEKVLNHKPDPKSKPEPAPKAKQTGAKAKAKASATSAPSLVPTYAAGSHTDPNLVKDSRSIYIYI